MQNATQKDNKPDTPVAEQHPMGDAVGSICKDHSAAARHHEHASNCHKEAIKCHEKGDHKGASACCDEAQTHAVKAADADKSCKSKMAGVHAEKPHQTTTKV